MAEGSDMPADPSLLLVHEDRISKVEERQAQLQSDISALKQQVTDGFDTVVNKLDDFKEALKSHAADDKETAATVTAVALQVQEVDKKQKNRIQKWESIGKYTWAIFLVIAGAAAKFFFDHMVK